ncbi:insulinase family protein [uncultured Desulfuromusa sp.]|uniref:insulinase family protein n=1 Tax=uncultured Desulfuromusa sp. TaxID=219183 RepID=UPI002AA90F4C|nr:insulinase family protein [uncultured Desulfuromusa sp.]
MNTQKMFPGQSIHGFIVEQVDSLPAINATMIRLQHQVTGARFMHLDRDDDNHLFAVGFRTPPDDSTGVAHILEHTALCGSERFPVRDPFFSMLKRSLNSFMNAMTASDWTLYPFSSMNRKDFHNLLDIYLDAAFFPRLTERDFSQEGHRLEYAIGDDPSSPLEYKGVVYNEMKGAMSDPSSLLSRRMDKHLYPTTTYRHNSGGEPEDIPDLSWQQLRDFHARYYHPSNSWFFSSGNLDLSELLAIVEDRVLKKFERLDLDSEVPVEQRLETPVTVTEKYPLDAGDVLEKRSMVEVAWLDSDINDSFERLAMSLLSALLLGNSAAPLYKALLDSGLGANLAPGTGYHDDIRTTYFAAGLQGTDPEHAQAIEKLILETLEQVAEEGFSRERIDAAIHRLEFSNREVTGDNYPYSLLLLMRLIGPWIHGGDPVAALKFEDNLGKIQQKIETEPFFENLIRDRLLNNQHRVTLLLQPDTDLGPRQDAATRTKLDKIEKQLSETEKQQLVERAKELQTAQEEEEDLSCLPTLELSDIPANEVAVPVEQQLEGEVETFWFAQPTNGIGVVALNFGLEGLTAEQCKYLPVFSSLLTQIGAGKRDYLQMAEAMEAVTGGISARTSLLDDPQDPDKFTASFELKGKALVRNCQPLFDLLQEMLLSPDFSNLHRIQTVLNQIQVSLENSVPQSGHTYAARAAAASLSLAGWQREQWSGISQVALIRELAAKPVEDLGELATLLAGIAKQLFTQNQLQTAVTVEAENFTPFKVALRQLIGQIPAGSSQGNTVVEEFTPEPSAQGLLWSIPVNYVTRVFSTVSYTHPDSAALTVLAKLLRAEFLHREIREKGGAYGGLAGYNPEAGQFSMLSYRDPHLVRTLQVYEQAIDWAVAGEFSPDSIKESILAVFGDLDKPHSPAGAGADEFANIRQGMTLEMRNHMRRQLLAVDAAALQRVAEKYLKKGHSSVAVLAGEASLQQANEQLEQPLELRKI